MSMNRPIAELVVGPGLSLDLEGLWSCGDGEMLYASLYPGDLVDTPDQRLMLADEGCRHAIWKHVDEGLRESIPEELEDLAKQYLYCNIEELPFVTCRRDGAMVFLPSELCAACGIEEGTALDARVASHGSLWLYPHRGCRRRSS